MQTDIQHGSNKLKVFIACSKALDRYRMMFRAVLSELQNLWDVTIEARTFEDFPNTLNVDGRQTDYNKFIEEEADVVAFIYLDYVGEITKEEFDVAFGNFCKKQRPAILVYANKNGCSEITGLKKRMNDLHQYYVEYENDSDLRFAFARDMQYFLVQRYKGNTGGRKEQKDKTPESAPAALRPRRVSVFALDGSKGDVTILHKGNVICIKRAAMHLAVGNNETLNGLVPVEEGKTTPEDFLDHLLGKSVGYSYVFSYGDANDYVYLLFLIKKYNLPSMYCWLYPDLSLATLHCKEDDCGRAIVCQNRYVAFEYYNGVDEIAGIGRLQQGKIPMAQLVMDLKKQAEISERQLSVYLIDGALKTINALNVAPTQQDVVLLGVLPFDIGCVYRALFAMPPAAWCGLYDSRSVIPASEKNEKLVYDTTYPYLRICLGAEMLFQVDLEALFAVAPKKVTVGCDIDNRSNITFHFKDVATGRVKSAKITDTAYIKRL